MSDPFDHNGLSAEQAIEAAREHVLPGRDCHVHEGWAEGTYRVSKEENVWSVYLPSGGSVGVDQVVVVSRVTGKIPFSGFLGE
jgi:membrane protein implicated in regulation of membrane protease activity